MTENIDLVVPVDLHALVVTLAHARREVEEKTKKLDAAERFLHDTEEWKELTIVKQELTDARMQLDMADAEVRKRAEDDFRQNGEKAVMPGVSVKLWTRYAYDAPTVTAWARANMPSLLVLDAKRLEKAAAAGVLADAPVSVVKEPRVQISADLSSYLS